MNPFSPALAWEYKDENFFPCITDKYRQSVRLTFREVPKDELEVLKASALELSKRLALDGAASDTKILADSFKSETPVYKRKKNKRKNKKPRISAEKGSVFDLMEYFRGEGATSLVRCLKDGNDGDVGFQVVDPVTSLRGKHVLLVCTFVPCTWRDRNAELLCRLWVLSKEIAFIDEFEILIVAKMRKKYQGSLAAFKQFFSGFPNRLAVSFDHPDLRDELCVSLKFEGELAGILIDPDGKIVKDHIYFIDGEGASGFPFTSSIEDSHVIVRREDMSLPGLLRCEPSTRLYKLGFPSESITVEQLSKNQVGLYVFRGGDKLRKLDEVYRLCQLGGKNKYVGPQFEVVLFCLPGGATDPATYEFEVHELLGKLRPDIDASSWWVCPYDNSTALRLLRKCRWFYYDQVDALFSIGPDGEFVDFCGGELLRNMGCDAYPFSLKVLIQRFVEWAEEVTLESLFTIGTTFVHQLVKHDNTRIDVKELRDKSVILYFDSIPGCCEEDCTFDNLIEWYPKIKQHEPDVEVVFIPYTAPERGWVSRPECKSEIPWIVCPYEPDLTDSLEHHSAFYGWCDRRKMMKGLRPGSAVAFGKGGRIQVLDVTRYLFGQGPDANPFCPGIRDLRRDIYCQMERDLDFMMYTNLWEYV